MIKDDTEVGLIIVNPFHRSHYLTPSRCG